MFVPGTSGGKTTVASLHLLIFSLNPRRSEQLVFISAQNLRGPQPRLIFYYNRNSMW